MVQYIQGVIHSTKISGNFGPKLNGSVRSNRKSFEKMGPPFEVDHFSRSDRLEVWLNGSRPQCTANKESITLYHKWLLTREAGLFMRGSNLRVLTGKILMFWIGSHPRRFDRTVEPRLSGLVGTLVNSPDNRESG